MYNIRVQEKILKDMKDGISVNDISLKYGIPASIVCNLQINVSSSIEEKENSIVEEEKSGKTKIFIVSSKGKKTTAQKKDSNKKLSKPLETLSKKEKKQQYIEFRDLSRKINILTKKGELVEAIENCNTPIGKNSLPILLQKVKALVLLGKQSPMELQKTYLLEAYQICDQYCLVEEGFRVQKENIMRLFSELNLDYFIESEKLKISNGDSQQLLKK